MRILTEAYKDRQYFIALNVEKTEGFWAKPLSSTIRRQAAQEALMESGGDLPLAQTIERGKLLQAALADWKGMYDMGGNELPFTKETLKLCCEHDPDLMDIFLHRVRNIARFGELDDEKK